MTFKAVLVGKTDAGQTTELVNLTDADLPEGDVTIAIDYSTGVSVSARRREQLTHPTQLKDLTMSTSSKTATGRALP